ncbi:IS3 family transposase [Pseudoramibacter alactolyticus]
MVAKRNLLLSSDEIRAIFKGYQGRYGVRRVYHTLRNQDFIVNYKRAGG